MFFNHQDASNRSEDETVYNLSTRESALGALNIFLNHNSNELVTTDVAKRILVGLNNMVTYLASQTSVSGQRKSAVLKDQQDLVRKRLFECYIQIPANLYASFHSILLRATVDTFALDPEKTSDIGLLQGQVGDIAPTYPFDFWNTTSLANGMRIDVAKISGAQSWRIGCVMNTEGKALEELVSSALNNIRLRHFL